MKIIVRERLANVKKVLGIKKKKWNIGILKAETEREEYERTLDRKLKDDGMKRNTGEE